MDTEIVFVKPEPNVDYSDTDQISYPSENNDIIKKEAQEIIGNISIKIERDYDDQPASDDQNHPGDRSLPDGGPPDSTYHVGPPQSTYDMKSSFHYDFYNPSLQLTDGTIIHHHLSSFADDTKLFCKTCGKDFATAYTLQRHLVLHTRIKFTCQVCYKEFTKQEQLDAHFSKHDLKNERLYPCDECEKKFKSSSNLMQHKRVHLKVKPHNCDICFRSFANRGNLVKHQLKTRCKTPVTEPLFCPICHKEFRKKFLLDSHLKRHDPERPYQCDLCGMHFKYKSTIIRHLQWHSGNRPFVCKYCNKSFTHLGLLKPHLRVHTGEKPYQCTICFKFFAHKHNMERHKVNHGRIKRLVCEICNKKFPRESRLIYHMRTHTNEKHFVCHVCNRRFTHKQNVLRHYGRKHPGFRYLGTETDAKVALKVWDKVKHNFEPHYVAREPEEILG